MKSTERAMRYEWYRLAHTPKLWGTLAVFLLFLLAVATAVYFGILPTDARDTPDREEQLDSLRDDAEVYREFLTRYGDNLSKRERRAYQSELNKIEFYLDTQTIPSDYANARFLTQKLEGREHTGFMFYIATISTFAVWAVSIVLAAFLFGHDYATGNYKHLLAATVGRKGIFRAKSMVYMVLCGGIYLALFVFALAFGATEREYLLAYVDGSYRAISTLWAFVTQYIGVGVLSLLLGTCTMAVCVLSRRPVYAAIAASAIYGGALLMTFAFANSAYENPILRFLNDTVYMPILCIQLHVGWFDTHYVIALVLHFAIAVGALLLAFRHFCKQDHT